MKGSLLLFLADTLAAHQVVLKLELGFHIENVGTVLLQMLTLEKV